MQTEVVTLNFSFHCRFNMIYEEVGYSLCAAKFALDHIRDNTSTESQLYSILLTVRRFTEERWRFNLNQMRAFLPDYYVDEALLSDALTEVKPGIMKYRVPFGEEVLLPKMEAIKISLYMNMTMNVVYLTALAFSCNK